MCLGHSRGCAKGLHLSGVHVCAHVCAAAAPGTCVHTCGLCRLLPHWLLPSSQCVPITSPVRVHPIWQVRVHPITPFQRMPILTTHTHHTTPRPCAHHTSQCVPHTTPVGTHHITVCSPQRAGWEAVHEQWSHGNTPSPWTPSTDPGSFLLQAPGTLFAADTQGSSRHDSGWYGTIMGIGDSMAFLALCIQPWHLPRAGAPLV